MNGFGNFETSALGKESTSVFGDLPQEMLDRRGMEIVVLLCGGDKSSQSKDIQIAKMLVQQDEEGSDGA